MKQRWIIITLAALVLVATALAVFYVMSRSVVPADIKDQLTFTLLVPSHPDVDIDRSSVKYDEPLKLLSYTATAFGTPVVFSEQPSPDTFTDIPQAYDKVLEGMGEYSKFDVDSGTVHLTRPKDLKGKQAAVLNTKGTLLFAKPDQDLTDDEWRQLMRSLVVVR
jgi:hypothetical protein